MKLLVKTITTTQNIKIWSKSQDTCIVQEYKDGEKSKKATSKIKEYNGKPYITCKGHRHYLEDFKEVDF